MAVANGIERLVRWDEGQHYLNAPSRGDALVMQVEGMTRSLHRGLPDDPLLAAYAIRDQIPEMYAALKALDVWVYAVTEAGPDDLPESGARVCP